MSKQTFSLKPFVKWVGGKRQLLKYINPLLPSKNEIKNYYEPFLGGGAVFLNYLPTKAIISDINEELIITWKVVKSHPIKLIDSLTKYVTKHNLKPKDTYIQTREIDYKSLSDIEIASRFIYLNKTGYNGMYRVNKNNKFNVPFGKKEKISISNLIDEENIKEVSKFLNNNDIKIYLKNFKDVISKCEEGDFIFVDPPYDVADECFGGYTPNKFGKSGQERLAKLLKELDEKKVKWMITNHNNDLINGLYKGFHINEVPVNRFINSNSLNRKNATVETIITNYKVLEEQKIIFKKELFLNQILKSSYNLEEYVSWDKISKSIEKNKVYINDFNCLFTNNLSNFKKEFNNLYQIRQESFIFLPLLIGRSLKLGKFSYRLDNEEYEYNYLNKDLVFNFMDKSGLINNLFLNSKYSNIWSYVLGVEVGLSSHDKKNKVGKFLPNYIESVLNKYKIWYKKEASSKDIGLTLENSKKFDFVFKINNKTYCLECNFFNSSGSKINSETNRFIALNKQFDNLSNFEFVWITDGPGIKSIDKDITHAIKNIKHLYNMKSFASFLSKEKLLIENLE